MNVASLMEENQTLRMTIDKLQLVNSILRQALGEKVHPAIIDTLLRHYDDLVRKLRKHECKGI